MSNISQGHSGAIVKLCQDNNRLLIHKSGVGVDRNYARMTSLADLIIQPDIVEYSDSRIVLTYIRGTTVAEYLGQETPDNLTRFICQNIDKLGAIIGQQSKDYGLIYDGRLGAAQYLPAPVGQIIDRLPRYLPGTQYHGDFTFDNMISTGDGGFALIDAIDTDLDNIYFDLAKLRQDIDCGWFMRHQGGVNGDMAIKLAAIGAQLSSKYEHYSNNAMAILALGRVWAYSTPAEQEWISNKMDMLWRSRC